MQEWGIGAATNTNHVIATAAPATISDDSFDTLVSQEIGNGDWPASDAQTMYVLWIPATTKISTQDDSGNTVDACTQNAGYHTETNYSDTSTKAKHYVYAIIAEGCSDPTQPSVFASATETAAHEIAEAATDPLPDIAPGLIYFDPKHFAWEIFQEEQDEVADACEFYASSYYEERADLPYYVSRLWSKRVGRRRKEPVRSPGRRTVLQRVGSLAGIDQRRRRRRRAARDAGLPHRHRPDQDHQLPIVQRRGRLRRLVPSPRSKAMA